MDIALLQIVEPLLALDVDNTPESEAEISALMAITVPHFELRKILGSAVQRLMRR